MEFNIIVTLFLKLWGVVITIAPVKKHVRLQQIPILKKERRSDSKLRCVEITYNKRVTKLLKCGSVSGGVFIKTDASVKSHLRENFPYKRPLSEEQLF